MDQTSSAGPGNITPPGILSLMIKDKVALQAVYMPFIKNKGIFIATTKTYKLGDEVFILLNLMDDAERVPVTGKVCWISPQGSQGNRAAGIGVQLNEKVGKAIRVKLETHLIDSPQDKQTHTL